MYSKNIMAKFGLLLALFTTWATAQELMNPDQRITYISAEDRAKNPAALGTRVLEECIGSLPAPTALEGLVTSQSLFLKGINGNEGDNQFVQVYSASVEINYLVRQKELVVATPSGFADAPPMMKVFDKSLKETAHFVSQPSEGQLYAGRSERQYYFDTAEAALADAKTRAVVWLKQQAPIQCRESR